MIVEPAPTNPRDPVRRALRLAGIVLPAVLLVAVVAAGVLGPRPVAQTEPEEPVAVAVASPDTSGDPGPSPVGLPLPNPDAGPFPAVVAGLAVLPVSDARVWSRSGSMTPIAVGGYLASIRTVDTCALHDAGDLMCERIAVLLAVPPGSGGSATGLTAPRLRVRLPAGVRMPDLASAGTPALVIVGRALQGSSSCDSFTSCFATFTADRVAWAAGTPTDVVPIVGAGIDPSPAEWVLHNRSAAEALVTGFSGTVLISALVHPDTLALLDPAASRFLAEARPAGDLIWYVRALETAYGSMRYPQGDMPPRVTWVVLDDRSGTPLAWGAG